jgi:general secretion pathway protein G
MQARHRDDREAGFTLIEILIVVSIIGFLMAVLANNFIGQGERAKIKLSDAQITKVGGTLERYRFDNGSYPSTEQGLEALIRRPSGDPEPRNYPAEGYGMRRRDLEDPWGAKLAYEAPGRVNTRGFDVCSLGPDGRQGGQGDDADICNYDAEDAR